MSESNGHDPASSHSPGDEGEFVAAVLEDATALDEARDRIDPAQLFIPTLRTIYEALLEVGSAKVSARLRDRKQEFAIEALKRLPGANPGAVWRHMTAIERHSLTRKAWERTERDRKLILEGRAHEVLDTPQESQTWPGIVNAAALFQNPPERPGEMIDGICFDRSKIFLFGASKSMKTFFLLHFAICIATGADWFGRKVKRGRVLFINLELRPYSFFSRMSDIMPKLGVTDISLLDTWNLRGHGVTVEQLRSMLRIKLAAEQYALIVVDPLYKLHGQRNENEAAGMADLLGQLEVMAHNAGASILIAHHHTKGSAAGKNAIDRGAGSGVSGRDADCIIDLSEHEEPDCFTLEIIVRDLPPNTKTVLRWQYPLFDVDTNLNPELLKKRNGAKLAVTEADVLAAMSETPQARETIIEAVSKRMGVGLNKCRGIVAKTLSLPCIGIERLPRPGTNPLIRYFKKA